MSANIESGLASLGIRAAWSRGLLLGSAILIAAGIGINMVGSGVFMEPVELPWKPGDPSSSTPSLVEAAYSILGFTMMGFFAFSPLLVLSWVHRAHHNLRTLRLDGLTYSPGWAVGSFFVPFVNLVVPFRAMRELCNRSYGESEYQAREPVGDVSARWTCWIVGGAIQTYFVLIIMLDMFTNAFVVAPRTANALLAWFGQLLIVGAVVLLYRIIGSVTRAQQSVTGVGTIFA